MVRSPLLSTPAEAEMPAERPSNWARAVVGAASQTVNPTTAIISVLVDSCFIFFRVLW